MPAFKGKCIIILSYKSSGSSPLQKFLTSFPQANHVSKTRHYEKETLYWTKAASVLDLEQIKMLDSEVPIPKEKARRDLVDLIRNNLGCYTAPEDDQKLIYDGWGLLCQKFSPIFVEKSPHHLCQWSALELIAESTKRLPGIDFLIIGLVRNPMDTLYSAWKRWKIFPEKSQGEWFMAYSNLLKFQKILPEKVRIIKYEDLVNDHSCLQPIIKFIGCENCTNAPDLFHSKSLSKWKNDPFFGFRLSTEVKNLATKFGYSHEEMMNESKRIWPFYRNLFRLLYKIYAPSKKNVIKIRNSIYKIAED